MGVLNNSAGTNSCSFPAAGIPDHQNLLIGLWYKIISVGQYPFLFGIYDSPYGNQSATLQCDNNGFYWQTYNGSTYSTVTAKVGTQETNAWIFTLFRTNPSWMRSNTLTPLGYGQASSGNTSIPAPNVISVGAYTGEAQVNMAELFVCSPNPFSQDANLARGIVDQLAYQGPFSIPQVASSLFLYSSLRQAHIPIGYGDLLHGNSALIEHGTGHRLHVGDHPPLPPSYVRPQNFIGFGMV